MDFNKFKNKHKNMPLFMSKDAVKEGPDRQNMRNQLKRWQTRGLIVKLRRGVYILNKEERIVTPSISFVANQLYSPSYVSLEYALGLYGLIPERVYDVTSITTKKTASFTNELGTFVYRHLKPRAFRAFRIEKGSDGFDFLIAEPEKAIVDFIYFNLPVFKKDYKGTLNQSYRFQSIKDISGKRLTELARLFNNPKLERVIGAFVELIKEELRHDRAH